ncbi:MAG: hypothetical protein HKN85_00040 [Gammaproteobacteria bacterium]|nr:hypothetical protein [Gammaproteobacteria bacterium]
MTINHLSLLLVSIASAVFYSNFSWAAEKPLFESATPIQAVLTAPITQTYRQRKQDVRLYFDGHFSYKNDQTSHKLPVKIRTRGNFRRLNCDHPPLHLNFVRKGNDNTLFEKQNKLKLVGVCNNSRSHRQLVALEYLAYKIWEEISNHHFRTRLINLSYVDTDQKKKPWTSTTFVIEDINDVAERLNKKVFGVERVSRRQMDMPQTALLELFQLLIGNGDYSTLTTQPGNSCCHNTRLLVDKGAHDGVIPIPYDFDVSGLVNASYAKPPDQYPIRSVRQRYFTGWCKEDRHFLSAIQHINTRRSKIYDRVQNLQILDDATRNKTVRYLDSFFKMINDEKRVKREIIGRCRGNLIQG